MKLNEEILPKLPRGWTWVKVNDIKGIKGLIRDGDWILSKDLNTGKEVRLIQLSDIGQGNFLNQSNKHLSTKRAVGLNCTFLEEKDILISRMAHPITRACIFPKLPYKCITAVDVTILRPDRNFFYDKFICWMFNSVLIRIQAEAFSTGTTRKRISRKNLENILIPFPPLPEQNRITTKIEELFLRLDSGVETLKNVKKQTIRYRQAVLKFAFEGKLTEKWRTSNKDKLEPVSMLLERIKRDRLKNKEVNFDKQTPVNILILNNLPELWESARVIEIGEVVTGSTPSKSRKEYYGCDFPLFKPTDLNQGYYVYKSIDGLSTKGIEQARLFPAKSILITCIGATIGKTGFTRKAGASNQQINSIITEKHIMPEYVFFMAISPQFQKSIFENASATTLPILNKSRFENLLIPIPPFSEQKKIVEEIETRFSIVNQTEKIIDFELKRAERLRQSILKRAFEGKLVPQDPNDEPASVLLERIKAEKARMNKNEANKKQLRLV